MNRIKKHYIITGASRGFGKDLALALSGENSVLHLFARSNMDALRKELRKSGSEVYFTELDLLEKDAPKELMAQVERNVNRSETERIVLINNAGMLEPVGPAGKHDGDLFRKHLELNFVVPIALTHVFIEACQKEPCHKRVVMVSSGAADKPYYGWSHYCSSKAGLNMFVKVMGLEQEQQPDPIEVMAFNPGRIDTQMQEIIRNTSEEDFPMVNDFINAFKEGKIGESAEIAQRLARRIQSDYFPSGKILSHRDI
ncbi:SDR family NAD(P)-dependent oxidoreductase [Balneolaceae bacterium ANBcel3]|nr:SDR family NAD(P)-dependent oxidoreductase [Balneolaceae bacterium ANBcel3]